MYSDIYKLHSVVSWRNRGDKRGLYEPRAVLSRGGGKVQKVGKGLSAIARNGNLLERCAPDGRVYPKEMLFPTK